MIGQHFLQGVLATHGVPAYPGQMPPPPPSGAPGQPQHHPTPSTNSAAQPTFIYQVSWLLSTVKLVWFESIGPRTFKVVWVAATDHCTDGRCPRPDADAVFLGLASIGRSSCSILFTSCASWILILESCCTSSTVTFLNKPSIDTRDESNQLDPSQLLSPQNHPVKFQKLESFPAWRVLKEKLFRPRIRVINWASH